MSYIVWTNGGVGEGQGMFTVILRCFYDVAMLSWAFVVTCFAGVT